MAHKFAFDKPKACPHCGEDYIKIKLDSSHKIKSTRKKVEEYDDDFEDDDEDEDDETFVPRHRKNVKNVLKNVSVSVNGPEVNKFGNIVGTDTSGENYKRNPVDKEAYKKAVFNPKPHSFE